VNRIDVNEPNSFNVSHQRVSAYENRLFLQARRRRECSSRLHYKSGLSISLHVCPLPIRYRFITQTD